MFIEQILNCTKIPGLSLAGVKDGENQMVKGYGVANLETQEPVTSSTKFAIASLTKGMTSLLLAELLQESG